MFSNRIKVPGAKADLYYNAVNNLEMARAKLRLMEKKSASPFQDDVSLLQERVRLYKQKCDRRGEEHTRALDDLLQAESEVHDVKSQASMMEVWRAAPLFQVLHLQQAKLKKAHHNLKFLTEKVSESKSLYSSAISDLERISTAVHIIRQGWCRTYSSAGLDRVVCSETRRPIFRCTWLEMQIRFAMPANL